MNGTGKVYYLPLPWDDIAVWPPHNTSSPATPHCLQPTQEEPSLRMTETESRDLKGICSLRDANSSKGTKYRPVSENNRHLQNLTLIRTRNDRAL